MPSLSHKALQSSSAAHFNSSGHTAEARSAAVWTRSNTDDVSLPQLHKFWSGLSVVGRRDLLRIDKQTLFEQVRKNLYCSRCHGLLVEGFSQIILYAKSLQAGSIGRQLVENGDSAAVASLADDSRDPSVHPWGGLAATRDSMLTVLDCFLDGMPLEVFESARARERERELLYPDACGGGGRGWVCQNGSFNGRGHPLKETCALHTARLSCEALVDFWSALGDETRRSLLRMKEEDFIERLMFRFNSKRFCRDCRRNVLREFKEMKELKRSRKEPQCTRWFCAADTVFRYEVSESVIQVDWQDCFAGDGGSAFQRFEWALGTGEGKSDILAFEDVGLSESAYVDSLDLSSTSACFITVRGWKRDGRYSELSAKAHALKGQLCVHRRLIVGDGYVSITKGESVQRFFERAEETEEEEDEDAIDKDGNEYEGEGSRPQKHAKSPELARDFLLDAATVIFKEQVEKAFREGTARQNAHSIFVCLALSLLEERVRVACKEITSLEKQNKLLEEEEYEKREEEERRERRKQKEKEKKLRRKEKLKSKEKGNRKNFTPTTLDSDGCPTASPLDEDHEEERESNSGSQVEGTESNNSEDSMSARHSSPDMAEARPSADGFDSENGGSNQHETFAPAQVIDDALGLRDGNGAFIVERSKSAKRRTQGRKGLIDNSNGSFRKGSIGTENSAFETSTRITNAQCFVERLVSNSQGQQKNGVHRIEADGNTKRVYGWSGSPSYNSNSMHEILQSCACGSSHSSSRSKVGHRGPGNTGIREPNPSSRAAGESTVVGGLSTKTPQPVGNLKSAESQGRSVTAFTLERMDLRVGINTERSIMPSHSKNSTLDLGFGITSGYHGAIRSSPNGSIGHVSVENGYSVPVAVKPMWTPRATTTSGGSNGIAVKVLVPGSRPLDSEHGRSDSLCNAQAEAVSPWIPASKPTSPKAISTTIKELTESIKEEPAVSETPSAIDEGEIFGVLDSNAPVPLRTIIATDGGQRDSAAIETDSKVEISPPRTTAPDNPPVNLSMAGVTAQDYTVSEDRTSAELQPGASGEGQESSHAHGQVVIQGAVNISPTVDMTSQVHHSSPSTVTLPRPSPHLHANGHQQVNFPQGSFLRAPSNGIYSFTADMMPSQGPLQHSLQPPNMSPSSMNMHHPGRFGFYPVGPWAARGRTGVLPLPQAGGYAVSGSGGLSMGVPPMSLGVPGSLSPGGLGPGHLPVIPDGLNPLQLGEHPQSAKHQVLLSRFAASPGRGPHARVMVERGMEGTVSADAGHFNESQMPLGQALSNGSSPLPGIKERRHTDSPTSADFSFFHSKWPISGGANENDASLNVPDPDSNTLGKLPTSASERIQCIGGTDGVTKASSSAGEYSLFASAPSKGFGFF
ncbi:hypothetical protein KC19_VG231800 [Ceratodon purpureus]|uniref:Stress response protein NST1 n=1 Tax=Ceratodon purpureus TaxID=3225 RepID=A0A8T0HTI0_CERPU|nr:hypothetical protein KC19_VG231800 [Ceratodon purpureus]